MNSAESRPDVLTGNPEGVPIPSTAAPLYWCAGCGCAIGSRYTHAASCPSLQRDSEAAALKAEIAALRKRIAELEARDE